MLTTQLNEQFNEILKELGKNLDITQTQYNAAVRSYQFVGEWLSNPDSLLSPYKPEILPQGSFLLGTMVRPIHDDDELDIDLVCRLIGKRQTWTQYDLKKVVGDRLKMHGQLKQMLDEEGRRCWTLLYSEDAKFHMDVLPALISEHYINLLEKKMSAMDLKNVEDVAIRITDKMMSNYYSVTDPAFWLKSNPFGYNVWFKLKASLEQNKLFSLRESIEPVPKFSTNKLPLQIVVQIFKRHRDMMFNGDCDKPISIIITTLAAQAYNKQTNILTALVEVANSLDFFIEERTNASGKRIKWICNPVNPQENFADKWEAMPKKQDNFYRWLSQLKLDLNRIMGQRGLENVSQSMSDAFGKKDVNRVFSQLAETERKLRENGMLKMAAGTGILSDTGRTSIPYHNNFGIGE